MPPSIGVFYTEHDCLRRCINSINCVKYVFYTNNGSCYLMTKYNPFHGVKDYGVISRAIKCK